MIQGEVITEKTYVYLSCARALSRHFRYLVLSGARAGHTGFILTAGERRHGGGPGQWAFGL